MATMVDVARMANVSISTVSHVLNGTKPVSDATRRRVDTAIGQLRFAPHAVARSLRRGRTNSIGLVVSDTGQFVFGQMIGEIEEAIRDAGLTLLLANSGEGRDQEYRVVRTLLDNRVDGMIVAPVADSDPRTLQGCVDAGCPYVLIDRTPDTLSDQVGTDNRSGMRALTNHLLSLGHTRIALLAGDLDVWTIHERTEAFRDALEAAGLQVDEQVILQTPRGLRDPSGDIEEFLRGRSDSTAVIAASGLLTRGALRAFQRVGLRVPADVAFVSFDGLMNSELFEPRLTAVVHPVEFIGREATRLLLRRIADPHAPPRTIQAQAALEHGTSCGCPAGTQLTLLEALAT